MSHRVTLIPGDGVGPEVTAAARRAVDASGASIEWDVQAAGAVTLEPDGSPLPERVATSIRERGAALKGPLATPSGTGFRSPNLALRDSLDLYAGVRPCKALPGAPTTFPDTDVVIVRMNGEDLYAGIEYGREEVAAAELRDLIRRSGGARLPDDAGISLKPISVSAARRVVRRAFEWAIAGARSRVTAVHKATVMRATDGLFLESARDVAAGYPNIAFDDRLVDAVCHDLVARPGSYDVLVMPTMYGDIVSDLAAGLIGGLGMAPGVNLGDECAVFEPVHGTAKRLAGNDRANPIATMLCGAMLLHHLGETEAARRLEDTIGEVVRDGVVTYDLMADRDPAKAARTSEVADAVVERLAAGIP